ncbi:MAG: AI-2E family transporter [Oscillospiraceae bacterium]|nr:AI-2E family transporter [Oscillospiraceae bacterium]
MKNLKVSDKKYLKIFLLAVCILFAYMVMFNFGFVLEWIRQILNIVKPFIYGFVIAYFINIPCKWLEAEFLKRKGKWKPLETLARPLSVLICILAVVLFAVLGLRSFIPMIYESLSELIRLIPEFIESAFEYFKTTPFYSLIDEDVTAIDMLLEAKPWERLFDYFFAYEAFNPMQFFAALFSGIFTFVLAIVSSIYFLLEWNNMKAYLKRLISSFKREEKRKSTLKYARLIDKSFSQFLTCQILDSLILGTITTIEFLIIGSDYALVLGIMLGMVNIIPYFGSIIGSCIAVLIIMFTQSFEIAVVAAIVLLITQQIDGSFINPKIMGTSFKISPVLVIIGITVGGTIGSAIGGGMGRVAGMIFAIPIVNVLKIVLEEYLNIRETKLVEN